MDFGECFGQAKTSTCSNTLDNLIHHDVILEWYTTLDL